jgi:hypothetical protein
MGETGNSDLDIPFDIHRPISFGKPIPNTEQGMSKDEVPCSLSQRERAGERENAFHGFWGEVELAPPMQPYLETEN